MHITHPQVSLHQWLESLPSCGGDGTLHTPSGFRYYAECLADGAIYICVTDDQTGTQADNEILSRFGRQHGIKTAALELEAMKRILQARRRTARQLGLR